MNILVTGAEGFVGKNLVANLEAIRAGKNRTRPNLSIGEIYTYDIHSAPEELDAYCAKADFVFHLAGVNRPKDPAEFMQGNRSLVQTLLDKLEDCGNTCPVMLSSSIQATCIGRYAEGKYGKSKRAGEELVFAHAQKNGAKALVYRFPNLFGKWCRPNYNSAVATFCNNIARDLPITVSDPAVELELLYIDDLVEEMFDALEGREHPILCRAGHAPCHARRDCASAGIVPRPAADAFYAVHSGRQLCQKTIQHIPVLSAAGKNELSSADEPGRPRQLYRAAQDG